MTAEPIKFLLVDDVEENLTVLEALLRREGLELLKARSASQALELLLVHDVALALLDVQMPEVNGFELAELMRGSARTKNVPIIFVTAGARDPQRVFEGYESGAVDFLFKPIDPHILRSKAQVFFELHRQQRELAEALRYNEMFMGVLGHDLRNPLNALSTGVQLLTSQLRDDEGHQRTLRRMMTSARRMTGMIDQLLDLTRARMAGGLGFLRSRRSLDVAQLVRQTVEELRDAHPEHEVTVDVRGDGVASGDEARLLQVFSNVIANALIHGSPGSPVTVTVVGGDEAITVAVHNAGAIAPEVLPSIFDPFRGQGRASSGLGLGLYIARQIAVAHGGDVTVESSVEGGTTFTVRVPRRGAAG